MTLTDLHHLLAPTADEACPTYGWALCCKKKKKKGRSSSFAKKHLARTGLWILKKKNQKQQKEREFQCTSILQLLFGFPPPHQGKAQLQPDPAVRPGMSCQQPEQGDSKGQLGQNGRDSKCRVARVTIAGVGWSSCWFPRPDKLSQSRTALWLFCQPAKSLTLLRLRLGATKLRMAWIGVNIHLMTYDSQLTRATGSVEIVVTKRCSHVMSHCGILGTFWTCFLAAIWLLD